MNDRPGQEVAQRPQNQTAMQKSAAERVAVRDVMLASITERRSEIETFLRPMNIDFEFFRSATQIGLNKILTSDPDFFEKVRPATFLREAVQAARLGLVPDGKKCAIVRYANDCSCLPMVEGYVDVLGRTGLIKDINHNVIIEGDQFDFEEGSNPFVKHRPPLNRDSNGKAIGAWCIITTTNGGYYQEVVNEQDLKRIAATSKAASGPRSHWSGEMHRKAPFRRLVKRLSKEQNFSHLQALVDADDRNYTVTPQGITQRAGGIPKGRLFADQRHVEETVVEQTAEPKPAAAKKGGPKPGAKKGRRNGAAAPEEAKAADAGAEQQPAASDDDAEERVAGNIAKMLGDAESLVDLGSTWSTLLTAIKNKTVAAELSPETMVWLEGIRDGRRKTLEEAAQAQAEEEQPQEPLRIIMAAREDPLEFDDPEAWFEAFNRRLGEIKEQHHEAFWNANKAYVLAAVKRAPQQAQSIILVMGEKNFSVGPDDGE